MPYKDPAREAERKRQSRLRNYDAARQRERYAGWKSRHPDGLWEQWLRVAHGMRPEQWHAYWLEQDGKCYLCEEPLPDDRSKVAIDHDHTCCGKKRTCPFCRRGLAHDCCNWLLGMLDEDIARMRPICSDRFIANFVRAQAATEARMATRPVQDALAAFAAE